MAVNQVMVLDIQRESEQELETLNPKLETYLEEQS